MKKAICRFILKLAGWKTVVTIPDLPKCVICVAPHTSNWDFLIGKLGYMSIGRYAGFLIKKDWFFFPFNLIFKAMGGIPVDRKKRGSMVDYVCKEFAKRKRFCIAITPEGTRKKNSNWKLGFYYIALKAKVPIVLAYLDYKKKEMGFKETFIPTGNEEADISYIKRFYKNITAKYPKNFAID